jgi:hypothetical protein
MRFLWLALGFLSLGLGFVGAFLPLLPTVPFILLAAFCFARGSPAFEQRLLDHPRFGPHIHAWRSRRAISPAGRRAAYLAFGVSALVGLFLLPDPWRFLPLVPAIAGTLWIARLPSA